MTRHNQLARFPKASARRLMDRAVRCTCEQLEERTLLSVLTIAQENQLAGTPQSQWDIVGAGDTSLQGFATDISVNVGGTVNFKINDTTLGSYHIEIYRLGYYQGNGARLVATIDTSQTIEKVQPNPLTNAATGLIDCGNWSVSASWVVPTDATSGVYIADLVRDTNGAKSQIPFIVRNDASHSSMVFQTSDTTWQAYNNYGGKSLYDYQSSGGRAYKVSYNRPFNTRANSEEDYLFTSEYPMIRWLEANGYDVTYISGVDTARYGALLTNHTVYLSVGHDEYWSGDQRANVEAARAAGVNLAFFSGNEVLWKTRWESSIDGSNTGYRTLVCYKESIPNAKIDPTSTWTGLWGDTRIVPLSVAGLPGNALTGQVPNVGDGATTAIVVPTSDGNARFWRNTTVATQGGTLSANTLGYEWDQALDNGFMPAGLIFLSTTTVANAPILNSDGTTNGYGTATHHLTLYRADSGAIVFGAGTVQWSWGLDGTHDRGSSTPDTRMKQATVNLFADMGIQPTTLQSGLVATTKSSDLTGPNVTINSPANGATLSTGSAVTIAGIANDSGAVKRIEVSLDGGTTWFVATGTTSWSFSWTPTSGGQVNIRARGIDDSLNFSAAPASITVTVSGSTVQTLFGNSVPTVASDSDSSAVEVGMKFTASSAGTITGIRFYKGSTNTGTHVGHLWSANGTLLATVTFNNESASGWQQALFNTPVSIGANTTYIVSYYAPNGHYAADAGYFGSAVTSGALTALADGSSGGNGVYLYGNGTQFPNQTYNATNYWVDVLFSTGSTPPPSDTTPPSLTSRTPASGATGVSTSTAITATFSEAINTSSLVLTLKDSAGNTVAATLSYSSSTLTATLTPSSALAAGASYSVTVSASDTAGNAMTPVTWSFTTASSSTNTSISLWSSSTTPTETADADSSAVELGMKFTTSVSGTVTAIRFYKGSTNTGTHIGHLWSATGTLLATVTFGNETASGWQEAQLSSPVTLSANTTYIVSYYAPNGHYAADLNYFASAYTNGSLTALASGTSGGNGVYVYGNGTLFPNQTYNATNYWVDVVFVPGSTPPPSDTTPPSITSRTPTSGATGVSTTAAISATFSEAINTSSLVFTVKDSGGTAVAGSVSYNASTFTATFTPSSALAAGKSYTVTVSVSDPAGNAMAPATWSFTTAAASSDTTAPTIVSRSPAPGATNVSRTTTVKVTFSEPIDASTLSFVLKRGSTVITATVTYDPATNTATLTPSSRLARGVLYSVTVSAADLAGNVMTPVTWSFTTTLL